MERFQTIREDVTYEDLYARSRMQEAVSGAGADVTSCARMGCLRMSMGSLRTMCVAMASGVTLMVLMGMVMEQEKVATCVNMQQRIPDTTKESSRDSELSSHVSSQLGAIVDALQQLKPSPNNSQPSHAAADAWPPKWNYNWDKKQWPNKDDAKGVGVRTLILIRHGKYDLNTGKLTDMGRQQANLTGLRLKELGMKYRVLTHSPMTRARETAQLVLAHLPQIPVYEDAILEEGGPVPPEPTISYWGLPERDYFVNGPRMESAFRKHFFRADKSQTDQSFEIIVGHGNLFRFFTLRAMQFPESGWMRTFIAHASITMLHLNPDGTVTMTKFGDSGHLPPNLVTY